MLTEPATPNRIEEWKRTYADYKGRLRPNRKSGAEVLAYLKDAYPLAERTDEAARAVVSGNVLSNETLREQLPKGASPDPVCFLVLREGAGQALYERQNAAFSGTDVFVGIDLASGWFCVEGSSLLWDELYAFRGLNETDLQNYYSVAEYVACLKRFGKLENALEK